jgi:hypothetical protein
LSGSSFVYILQHATEDRIKIGYSFQPYRRSQAMPDKCDPHRSLQMEVDAEDAEAVERLLHFVARRFRLSLPYDGNGSTEWFEARALAVVLRFITRNPDLFSATFKPMSFYRKWPTDVPLFVRAGSELADSLKGSGFRVILVPPEVHDQMNPKYAEQMRVWNTFPKWSPPKAKKKRKEPVTIEHEA